MRHALHVSAWPADFNRDELPRTGAKVRAGAMSGVRLEHSGVVSKTGMPYIRRMQGARQFILTACVVGSAIGGFAEAPVGDSYKSIVDRNPFGLKDPPPPPPAKDPNPPPAVKKEDFYLTGISTIGNP